MARLVFLVSSARHFLLRDGAVHPTGYAATEVLTSYERFTAAGLELLVVTPDGRKPAPDPYTLEPMFFPFEDDEEFLASVIRSFARHPEHIRITLQDLTDIDLIAGRRVFKALTLAGVQANEAREWVEQAARKAWRGNRSFIEVLSEECRVTERLPAETLRNLASQLQADSSEDATAVAERLESIPELCDPHALAELGDDELASFDGLFVPGGHGGLADLPDNPDVGRAVRVLHHQDRMIATLAEGAAALLPAGPGPDGKWLFDGFRMTSVTDEEQDQTRAGQRRALWSIESRLKNAGAVFDRSACAWTSQVVIDRNLLTAQNLSSTEAVADAVLKGLAAAVVP